MRDHARLIAALLLFSVLLLSAGCAERQQAALDPFVEQQLKQQSQQPNLAQAETNPASAPESAPADGKGLAAGGQPDDFDAETEQNGQISDPLEPWNRFWYGFNDVFYSYLFRPIGLGYNYVAPTPLRTGVSHFFFNWKFPIRFVNCLLQGKFLGAGVEFSRFMGNTLFGGLGFYNILEDRKAVVEPDDEDFGQTLGVWGIGAGPYIVWPLLGPSTLRDSFGLAGDYMLDPITYINPWYLPYSNPTWWSITASGARTVTTVADHIEEIDALKESSVEEYSAFRNVYVQTREKKLKK
jgi:phospholipid-binding lipoprotein MlaA